MIDLHLHSTASDGTLAPAEVVRRAARGGLEVIALTDHDTTEGIDEALAAGEAHGVTVIPGLELSLRYEGPGTLHMIGLFVDRENGPLRDALARVRRGRDERNERLAEKLAGLGVPVTVEEAKEQAGGDVLARPHFAKAMVAAGWVSGIKEAFDRYLGKGKPGYVGRDRLEAAGAIELVHGAGGVAVLCHPATLGLGGDPEGLREFVRGLAALGLDAIEVRYSERDPASERRLRRLAGEAGLLESGGSDFHGLTPKELRTGLRRTLLDLPITLYRALRARAEQHRRREE